MVSSTGCDGARKIDYGYEFRIKSHMHWRLHTVGAGHHLHELINSRWYESIASRFSLSFASSSIAMSRILICNAAQSAIIKLSTTATIAGMVGIPSSALARQSSSFSCMLAISVYESIYPHTSPRTVYMTTISSVSAGIFEELQGTGDLYTTIDGIPDARGAFTATATSELYRPITSWTSYAINNPAEPTNQPNLHNYSIQLPRNVDLLL